VRFTLNAQPWLLATRLHTLQDTPGAKMSYTATVRVPKPLTALMSAVATDAPAGG